MTLKIKRNRWHYENADKTQYEQLLQYNNIPSAIAEIMAKRGVSTVDELDKFFNTSLSHLVNPFDMLDMEKAANRIADAVVSREKMFIYGDYDVDGVTSTSLMYLFLTEVGADVDYYIPNRLEEGYGLNIDAIREIADKSKLIITVDCGISAIDEISQAKGLGIDIIVTDHHRQAETLPDAYAIVNPQRDDDTYPFKALAGVGVAFKVIMALRYILKQRNFFNDNVPNLRNYLDIVTLGTIADVMSLTGENRVMVKSGLQIMSNRVGIAELKSSAGIVSADIRASDVSFKLAPRINAMGRLGSAAKSIKLLITDDKHEAKQLAYELNNENNLRREIEHEIIHEAFNIIDKRNLADKNKGLVIVGKDWHLGVIGIVASRVVDKYFRPTVILSSDGDVAKGSARSIPAFHLYDGLSGLSDLLLSFGGHKYAAGIKITHDNIDEFTKRFNDVACEQLTEDDLIPILNIDAVLEAEDIDDNMLEWLQKLEPYGVGNKEPVFCMQGVTKYQSPSIIGRDGTHLKCYFDKGGTIFESIGFGMSDYYGMLQDNDVFDLAFVLKSNKRSRAVQLELRDIRKTDKL